MFSALHTKTKLAIIAIFVIISLIIGFVMSFCLNLILPTSKPIPKQTATISAQETPKPTVKEDIKKTETTTTDKNKKNTNTQTTDAKQENSTSNKTSFEQGTYIVGKDIKAGLYKLIATDTDSYYKIMDGKGDEEINVQQDMVFFNFTYVDLKDGQEIYVFDAKLISQSAMTPYNDSKYISGQYKIGYDMPEGDYIVSPKKDIGNIKLSSSPNESDIIFSQYIESTATISVKKGQYLTLNNVEIKNQ